MGVPSLGILLHEIIKLMYHAKCKDPTFIRIGTCGGVGIEGGTVVISDDAVDGLLRSTYEIVSMLSAMTRIIIVNTCSQFWVESYNVQQF